MPPLRHDTTAILWRVKGWAYRRSRFSIIAPSRWMTELVHQSPLLTSKHVRHIPNVLDTDYWKPIDKLACKNALDLPSDKKVVLFVGKPDRLFFYRGRGSVLLETLELLRRDAPRLASQIVVLLVGEGGQDVKIDGYRVAAVGRVTSHAMMRVCYNAADLVLDPTQFDNLPGVLQEAMACGVPTVASNVGGIPDLVQHTETGYLARRDVAMDFSDGIRMLLSDDTLWARVSENARRVAVAQYHHSRVLPRIIAAYEDATSTRLPRSVTEDVSVPEAPRIGAGVRAGALDSNSATVGACDELGHWERTMYRGRE